MSRTRPLVPLLALALAVAACAGGPGAPTAPGATQAPAAGALAVESKILAEAPDAILLQEGFAGTGALGVRLPYNQLQIPLDKAYQLRARIQVRAAQDLPARTWTSSDPSVVAVVQGQLVGKKLGSALITVEVGGQKATTRVNVVAAVALGTGAAGGGTGTGATASPEPGSPIVAVDTLPGELAYGRQGAYAVKVAGGQVAVVGGSDGAKPLNSYEVATYQASQVLGQSGLGTFRLSLEGFIQFPREGNAAIAVGPSLYVMGGEGQGIVERWHVAGTGGGPWERVPSQIDVPRRYMAKLVTPSWVMLLGGEPSGGGALGSVEYAPIVEADEVAGVGVGEFAVVEGATMLAPRAGLGAAVFGQQVYVFGGAGGDGSPMATVERAPLREGGLGAFEAVPGAGLLTPRQLFSTVQDGSNVYVLGGEDVDGRPLDTIERATFRDGQLGPFEVVGFLQAARSRAAAALLDGEIMVAGGRTADGVTRDVELVVLSTLRPGATRPGEEPAATPAPSATPTATP